MFRQHTQSPMSVDNFGVGSVIYGSNETENWAVITIDDDTTVYLLDMRTMHVVPNSKTPVSDKNHLTEREVRFLIRHLPMAFSDYDFDAHGIKFMVFDRS
jgi:precorrin-3B methylase